MAIEFDIKESEILKGVFIIKPNKFKDLRGRNLDGFHAGAVSSFSGCAI